MKFIIKAILAGSLILSSTALFSQNECSNAVNLPFESYSTCGNLAMQSINLATATHSSTTPDPGCASFGSSTKDFWYTITVPAGINTLAFHMFNSNVTPFLNSSQPGMAVYRGTSCTSLTLLDCFESSGGFMENGEIRFEQISGLVPGETLYIRVWDENNVSQQIFLIVSELLSLPEDDCSTPVPLGTGGCNILSTGGDITAPEDCGWNTTDNSIFYYFTVYPDDPQPYTITAENGECWANSGGENPEIQFAVYSWNGSNCNGIGGSGSSYQGCANGTGVVTFSENLPPGNYILAFDGYSMMSGNSLCIFGFEAPFITPELTVTLNTTNAICGSSGSASITVVESCTGNPVISWSNSASGYTVQNLAPGNYSVTVADGVECGDTVINFTITDSGSLSVDATVSGESCEGDMSATATVTGADPGQCNFAWNTTPPQYTQTVTDLSAGTYTVTVSLGSCTATDQVLVTVYDNITVNNLTTDCNSTNTEFTVSFTVTGSSGGPAPFNANWGSGNQSFTGSFSQNFTSPGTYNITVTDNNNCDEFVLTGNIDCGCQTYAGTMSSLQPIHLCQEECTDAVSHNGDQALDSDDTFEFIIHTGGFPATILGRSNDPVFCLNDIQGGGSFETVYYISSVAGNNSGGHVSQSDQCYSQSVGTPVIWHQNPIAYINGTELETCGNIIHLSAMAPPSGMIAYWSSESQFVPIGGSMLSSPEINVLVNTYGDITFYWNVQNQQCTGRDSILVHFYQTPSAYAGEDMTVCGNTVDLEAVLSLETSNGLWSGNGATFSQGTNPESNVIVSNFGTYVFTWSEFNGTCFDQDNVTINFIQTPTPTVSMNHDTICGVSYNLHVYNVTGEGIWTAFDDGVPITPTYVPPSTPYSPDAVVVVPAYSGLYNTIEFCWTEINDVNGIPCTAQACIEVTFSREPSASVGPDSWEQVCGNVFTFAADTLGSGWAFGTWICTELIASFDDINDPHATVTIDSLGSFGDSAYVEAAFLWVMNNTGCTSIDTMHVTFYDAPYANAGVNDSICGFEYELHAYYSIPLSGGYTPTGWWYFHDGPGVPSILNQSNPVTSVTVSAPGTYRFVWQEANTNLPSCYSTDTVTIKFFEIPLIYAGDDFNVCGQCTTLNCTSAGFPGSWQPMPGVTWGNTSDPHTTICSQQYGPREFIWQEANGMCTNRDTVVVTFWRVPTAEILTDPADSTACGLCFNRLQAGIPGEGITGSWRDLNEPSANFMDEFQGNPDSVCVTQYGIH
ncbi:MAG: hypothetical protein KBB11_02790, partial [Bacteroidales bacterium]|nr:hypothetical protein [Bacteroidales bacterium]